MNFHQTSNRVENFAIRAAIVASIILFLVFPFMQVYSTRSAPLFLAIAALVVMVPEVYIWKTTTEEKERGNILRTYPVLISFWLLVLWISLSVFWSPVPEKALFSSFTIACYALCTWLLSRALTRLDRSKLFWLISISMILVSLFLISELLNFTRVHKIIGNQSPHDLNRNVVFLVGILWPLFLLVKKQSLQVMALSAAVILVSMAVFISASGSAKLALISSACVFLLLKFLPKATPLVFVFLAAAILVTPIAVKSLTLLTPTFQSQNLWSAAARFSIWEGHMKLLKEKPIFGHGAFGDRDAGKKEKIPFTSIKKGRVVGTKFTTHAHSSVVQIWFNFGLVGAILTSILMLAIGWRVKSFTPLNAAVTTVTIASIFFATVAGASLFQGWVLAGIAITSSLLIASLPMAEAEQSNTT